MSVIPLEINSPSDFVPGSRGKLVSHFYGLGDGSSWGATYIGMSEDGKSRKFVVDKHKLIPTGRSPNLGTDTLEVPDDFFKYFKNYFSENTWGTKYWTAHDWYKTVTLANYKTQVLNKAAANKATFSQLPNTSTRNYKKALKPLTRRRKTRRSTRKRRQ